VVVTDVDVPERARPDGDGRNAGNRADLPAVIRRAFVSGELSDLAVQAGVRALPRRLHTCEELADRQPQVLGPGAGSPVP